MTNRKQETMLHLAEGLPASINTITSKTAVIGMSGSGKSYFMSLLAEQILKEKHQVCWLDPKGEGWGLRLLKDGKTKAFDILVLGGQQGDAPINPRIGAQIATLIVKENYSAVVDLSEFSADEIGIFGADFASEMLRLKKTKYKTAMCLMVDEAPDFVPQTAPTTAIYNCLAAFQRMQKQGRSAGIGLVLAAQRTQDVNNAVLNLSQNWVAFQLAGSADREAMIKQIGKWDKEVALNLEKTLPALEQGQAYIWSPKDWKVSGQFNILEKTTFDTSSTPEVNAKPVKPKSLDRLKLAEINDTLKGLAEEAEKNDPKVLNRTIAELRHKLKSTEQETAAAKAKALAAELETAEVKAKALETVAPTVEFPVGKIVEVQKFLATYLGWLDQVKPLLFADIAAVQRNIDEGTVKFSEIVKDLQRDLGQVSNGKPAALTIVSPPPKSTKAIAPAQAVPPPPKPPTVAGIIKKTTEIIQNNTSAAPALDLSLTSFDEIRDSLAPKQRDILDVLLSFEGLGIKTASAANVAIFSDQSPTSGTYGGHLTVLRNKKGEYSHPALIQTVQGKLALTEAGRGCAVKSKRQITSRADLLDAWCDQLGHEKQAAMLRLLAAKYPDAVLKDDLATDTEQSPTSGTYGGHLTFLRKLGVIKYTKLTDPEDENKSKPAIAATDVLCPDGLL